MKHRDKLQAICCRELFFDRLHHDNQGLFFQYDYLVFLVENHQRFATYSKNQDIVLTEQL